MKQILLLVLAFALDHPVSAQQLTGDAPPTPAAQKLLDAGDDCYTRQDFSGALRFYTQAVSAEPGLAHAHYNRGAALVYLKHRPEALAEANDALRLNPKYADAFYLRGRIEDDLQQIALAMADYTRAIALARYAFVPETEDSAYTNRGKLLAKRGDYAGALSDYNHVLIDAPSDDVLYERGLLWEKQHRWDEALSDYNAVLKTYPNYANVYVSRGWLRFVRGDQAGALDDFSRALTIPAPMRTPGDLELGNHRDDESWCLTDRGLVYIAQGRRQEARRDFDQAILLNPKNLYAYDSRGDERASLGDRTGAVTDYRTAATLDRRQHNTAEAVVVEAKLRNVRMIP